MNESYIVYLTAGKKATSTIEKYCSYIQQMLDYIDKPENEITYLDLLNWQSSISKFESATVCLRLSAIRSYFNFLYMAKVITENPAEGLEAPKKVNKEKPYPEASMIRAMVDNARTSRDKAIILAMATTGLRVSELISITYNQYLEAYDTREITIKGKGNKYRTVYFNDEVMSAIENYLPKRRADFTDKLFTSFRGTDLDSWSLCNTMKTTAKRAGIPFWKDVCNHWLRAGFATTQAEAGTPVSDIQAAMGHSSLATTSVYIKHTQARVNAAMNKSVF